MQVPDEQLTLLTETIRLRPNLDSAYIGYPDGSFYFVAQSDEEAAGGFRTRTISFDGDERTVELTWTDSALRVLRSEVDPSDNYDPRERPWYQPIRSGVDRNWTAPYVFASSQSPGITHSRAVRSADGELQAVVGIDIRLQRVNEFLEELSPGDNGTALVVDDTGQIIAESSMDIADLAPETQATGVVALSQSSELLGLVNEFADAESETLRARSVDGLRTTIVRPAGARDEWYLAVRALDEDFLNDDRASNAFETFAVGVTVAAAIAAAGYALLRYMSGLRQEAEMDELTNVYNRRAVKRDLRAMLARDRGALHLAIIDLDNFKSINDVFGHAAGDQVLSSVAERMLAFAEASRLQVGRLGGDEFVAYGEGSPPDWAVLNASIAAPIQAGEHEFVVTASIGVADARLTTGDEVEDLFRAADHLLFDAKRQGGNQFKAATPTN